MLKRIAGVATTTAFACLLWATAASALTIQVNTTADDFDAAGSCSLREAIDNANLGAAAGTHGCSAGSAGPDTITFAGSVTPSIQLAGSNLLITSGSDVTIQGPGAGVLEVKGDSNLRSFQTQAGATLTVSGIKVTSASNAIPGGGFLNAGTLNLGNAEISNNIMLGFGGAINSSGTLHLTGTRVIANDARLGGGVYVAGGTATIDGGTVIDGNRGTGPGPLYVGGGGIYVDGGATANVDDSSIINNQAYVDNTGVLGSAKSGSGWGAGVFNYGSLTVTDTAIDNNTVSLNVTNGTDNDVDGLGAGIYSYFVGGQSLDVDRSSLINNSIQLNAAGGAGVDSATGLGSGLYTETNGGTIARSTIATNNLFASADSATLAGAGVYSTAASTSITSSTVFNNEDFTGSNLTVSGASRVVNLANTILANETPGAGSENCLALGGGAFSDGGANDDFAAGEASNCGLTGITANPLLEATPSANGGPTRTLMPQPGSPVIDKGSAPGETTDQRGAGFIRPADFANIPNQADGSDIGVVEVLIAPPTFTGSSPASPGSDDTPTIQGAGVPASTIALFTNSGCTTQTGSSAPVSAFSGSGITVGPVPHNAATTFHGKATTAYGTSLCSSGGFPGTLTYTHADPQPQVILPPAVNPTPIAKKCKKRQKLRKGKCVKKKRKKK